MKLGTVIPYIKKIQKYINHVTHPLSSDDISIFSKEISNFSISRNTDADWLHFDSQFLILLTLFCFNKHGYYFDNFSKNGYSSFFEIKVFWNKSYDVIIFPHGFTNKILSRDSNYIVDVVKHFYERSYHDLNFKRISPEKPLLWRVVLVQVQ